jgi:hypothetical protein
MTVARSLWLVRPAPAVPVAALVFKVPHNQDEPFLLLSKESPVLLVRAEADFDVVLVTKGVFSVVKGWRNYCERVK